MCFRLLKSEITTFSTSCAHPEIHYQGCIRVKRDEFHYVNHGENPAIDGVYDAEGFVETTESLSLLGFNRRELSDMFNVLAAMLHLGNVSDSHVTSR